MFKVGDVLEEGPVRIKLIEIYPYFSGAHRMEYRVTYQITNAPPGKDIGHFWFPRFGDTDERMRAEIKKVAKYYQNVMKPMLGIK